MFVMLLCGKIICISLICAVGIREYHASFNPITAEPFSFPCAEKCHE